jgi:hypothetical protein
LHRSAKPWAHRNLSIFEIVFQLDEEGNIGGGRDMNYTYLHRLYAKRAELESKLELHDARNCFGEEELEDGTQSDLRERLNEISDEIAALEQSPGR